MRSFLTILLACSACAPAQTRAPAATGEPVEQTAEAIVPEKTEADAGPPPREAVPTACATPEAPCVPDAAYVKRLCGGSFPELPLVIMSKEAPFTRMYLQREVDAWNAEGGPSPRVRLPLDEEVVVLKRRAAPANAIVVGAGGGYLVMRWDGNCYTLEDSEVTAKKPPSPKHAAIPWRFYSEPMREALSKSPRVQKALERRTKDCKDAPSRGEVGRACAEAEAALGDAVVTEVKSGAALPIPEWRP
jgi:hypothetical protein